MIRLICCFRKNSHTKHLFLSFFGSLIIYIIYLLEVNLILWKIKQKQHIVLEKHGNQSYLSIFHSL